MGSFHRVDSQRWWRDGEYIPKNSRWLLQSLQGVHGTVESIVNLIEGEEDTDTPVIQADKRERFVEKVKEMCKAYYELVEQHDRLVGASYTHNKNSSELSKKHDPLFPTITEETETKARMDLLKENEIEGALTEYNGLAKRLSNVEGELSVMKNELAKNEEMLSISEKLNYHQKLNLESLRLKLESEEKELKQKREEVERIKPRLNELEMYKSNWDNKMGELQEEIKNLNNQKDSLEKRINKLLRDLSLFNETKKKLESLQDKVKFQDKELKQKEEEIERIKPKLSEMEINKSSSDNKIRVLEEEIKILNNQKVSYEERISRLVRESSLLNETKENLKLLRQKVEIQEKELKQKREEIERINPKLSEMEIYKSSSDNKIHGLEEQIKNLNYQNVSNEERINRLLRDLSLLNQTKEKNKSLRQKGEIQENGLNQKREDIERIKPRLIETKMHKNNLDNKMSLLEEEIRGLNNQKVSHEERIDNLLKDLSLLKETKENLEKEVALHKRDKDNLQRQLTSQILKASMVRSKHKEELAECKIENEILLEKNGVLDSTLSKANIEFETLKKRVLALDGSVEILTRTINAYLKRNNRKISSYNLKSEQGFVKAKSNGNEISGDISIDKEAVFTQVQLLEEQIKMLDEAVKEAECFKLDAENKMATLNIDIERFNVLKPSSAVAAYDLLIRMRIWRDVDVFLNKMPVWRKFRDRMEISINCLKEGFGTIKCRSFGLPSWLSFFIAHFFRFFGAVKYHTIKCIRSIRTVLYFYWSFFTARFLSKEGIREIDLSHSKAKNDSNKIKDGIGGALEEVRQLEKENKEESLTKREGIEKITELQQEELKEKGE